MFTPIRGFARFRARLPPAILAFALLATPGCDDLEEIEPEDQRIQVGVVPASVCPDAIAGAPGEGLVNLRATVFAGDGTTAEDTKVTFSSTRGAILPDELSTDAQGNADTELTAMRASDNASIVVTGRLETGESSEREIPWPPAPTPCLFATSTSADPTMTPGCLVAGNQLEVEVGATFDLVVGLFEACNVAGIEFDLSYDASIIQFDEARETGVLDAGGSIPTTLSAMDLGGGSVRIDYRQSPLDIGTNDSFSGYVTLTFTVLAPSPGFGDPDPGAGLSVDSYSVVVSDGQPDYPNSEFAVLAPTVVTVDP